MPAIVPTGLTINLHNTAVEAWVDEMLAINRFYCRTLLQIFLLLAGQLSTLRDE
jgi:hypothetical protein